MQGLHGWGKERKVKARSGLLGQMLGREVLVFSLAQSLIQEHWQAAVLTVCLSERAGSDIWNLCGRTVQEIPKF